MSNKEYKYLMVNQKAYADTLIFAETKKLAKEEMYSLTNQIQHYSLIAWANLAETYRKQIYPRRLVSKLSDSEGEFAETTVHLDFSKDCGYLSQKNYRLLLEEYIQTGRMLGSMMKSPEKFALSKLPTASADKKLI